MERGGTTSRDLALTRCQSRSATVAACTRLAAAGGAVLAQVGVSALGRHLGDALTRGRTHRDVHTSTKALAMPQQEQRGSDATFLSRGVTALGGGTTHASRAVGYRAPECGYRARYSTGASRGRGDTARDLAGAASRERQRRTGRRRRADGPPTAAGPAHSATPSVTRAAHLTVQTTCHPPALRTPALFLSIAPL